MAHMKIHLDAIYLGDNGRATCGEHLGSTAKATGRDLDGERIYRVRKADAQFWQQHSQAGHLPMCEQCGKAFTV